MAARGGHSRGAGDLCRRGGSHHDQDVHPHGALRRGRARRSMRLHRRVSHHHWHRGRDELHQLHDGPREHRLPNGERLLEQRLPARERLLVRVLDRRHHRRAHHGAGERRRWRRLRPVHRRGRDRRLLDHQLPELHGLEGREDGRPRGPGGRRRVLLRAHRRGRHQRLLEPGRGAERHWHLHDAAERRHADRARGRSERPIDRARRDQRLLGDVERLLCLDHESADRGRNDYDGRLAGQLGGAGPHRGGHGERLLARRLRQRQSALGTETPTCPPT